MKGILRGESIFIGFMALLCSFYLISSLQMRMGTMTEPGPGFVPSMLGVTGLIASLVLFIAGLKNPAEETESMPRDGLMRFIGYLITTIAFVPIFEFLGTMIALFFLVLCLTKISGGKGWLYPILLAAICSGVAYSLFALALDVPLPTGIF